MGTVILPNALSLGDSRSSETRTWEQGVHLEGAPRKHLWGNRDVKQGREASKELPLWATGASLPLGNWETV